MFSITPALEWRLPRSPVPVPFTTGRIKTTGTLWTQILHLQKGSPNKMQSFENGRNFCLTSMTYILFYLSLKVNITFKSISFASN